VIPFTAVWGGDVSRQNDLFMLYVYQTDRISNLSIKEIRLDLVILIFFIFLFWSACQDVGGLHFGLYLIEA